MESIRAELTKLVQMKFLALNKIMNKILLLFLVDFIHIELDFVISQYWAYFILIKLW